MNEVCFYFTGLRFSLRFSLRFALYNLIRVGLLIILTPAAQVWAQLMPKFLQNPSEVSSVCGAGHYRFGLNGYLHGAPSTKNGQTELGNLNAQGLIFCQVPNEPTLIASELSISPAQNLSQDLEFQLKLRQLNITLGKSYQVYAGLFWDPWIYQSHKFQGYHLTDADLKSLAAKANFLAENELMLGFKYKSESWQIGVSLSNGEFWPQKELGPNKDVTLSLSSGLNNQSGFYSLIYAKLGRFDLVNQESSRKNRAGLLAGYLTSEAYNFGASYLAHQTGVDGVTQQSLKNPFAEQVNLTALGGTQIEGYLSEVWVSQLSKAEGGWGWLAKWGQAVVDEKSSARQYTTYDLVLRNVNKSKVMVDLFMSQTLLPEGYSADQKSRGFFGFQISWQNF